MYALPVPVPAAASTRPGPGDVAPELPRPRAGLASDLPPTPCDDGPPAAAASSPAPAHPSCPLKPPSSPSLAPAEPALLAPPPELLARAVVDPLPAPSQPHAAPVSPSPLSASSDPPPDLLPDACTFSPASAVATTPSLSTALASGPSVVPRTSDPSEPAATSASASAGSSSGSTTHTSAVGAGPARGAAQHAQGASGRTDYFAFPPAGARRKAHRQGHVRGAVSHDALDTASLSASAHLRRWPSFDVARWADSSLPGLAALGRQPPTDAWAAASSHPAGLAATTTCRTSYTGTGAGVSTAGPSGSSRPAAPSAPGFRFPPPACAAPRRPLLDPLDMSFRRAGASRPVPCTPPTAARVPVRGAPDMARPVPVSPPRTQRRQASRLESPEITPERTAQAWAGGVGHFAPGLRLKLLDVLDALVDHVPLPDQDGGLQTVMAVEYGALHSRGHPILQSFVSHLSCKSDSAGPQGSAAAPYFSILHTDMPGTDFREVMASDERDHYGLALTGAPHPSHLAERVFESYTARAFGAPIAPPATVRFGLSLMDLHWAHPRAADVSVPPHSGAGSTGLTSLPPSPDDLPDVPFAGGFPSALPLPSPHPLTPPAVQVAQQQGYFALHRGAAHGALKPGAASEALSQVLAEPLAVEDTDRSTSSASARFSPSHIPLDRGLAAPPAQAPALAELDAAQELSTFLAARAAEFAPGGILLVAYLAAPSDPSPPTSAACTTPDGPFEAPSAPSTGPGATGSHDPQSPRDDTTHDFWGALTSLLAPCIQRLVSTALVSPDVARRMLALPLTLRSPQETRTALAHQQDWDVVWSCGLEEGGPAPPGAAQSAQPRPPGEAACPDGPDGCDGCDGSSGTQRAWPESEWGALRVAHPAWAGLRGGLLTGGTFAGELVALVESIYGAHLRRVLRTRARFAQGTAAIVLDTLWDHLRTRVEDLRDHDDGLLRRPVHVEICTLALQRRAPQ